jgi:hypothetical protein
MLSTQERSQIKTELVKTLLKLGISEEISTSFIEKEEITPENYNARLKRRRQMFLKNIVNLTTNRGAWDGMSYSGSYMNEVEFHISTTFTFYCSNNKKHSCYGSAESVMYFLDDRHDAFYIDKNIRLTKYDHEDLVIICDFELDKHIYVDNAENMINACKYIKNVIATPNTLKINDNIIQKIDNSDY